MFLTGMPRLSVFLSAPFPQSPSRADLTKSEQDALAFVYDLRNRFESGDIPPEKEEGGGGLFGAIKYAFNQ